MILTKYRPTCLVYFVFILQLEKESMATMYFYLPDILYIHQFFLFLICIIFVINMPAYNMFLFESDKIHNKLFL